VTKDDLEYLRTAHASVMIDLLRHTVRFSLAVANHLDQLHAGQRSGATGSVSGVLNLTAGLAHTSEYVEPICDGIWTVQWALLKMLLASLTWLVVAFSVGSLRAKYTLMDTLATLKQDLALSLDSDHDGTLQDKERLTSGEGLVSLMASQFESIPAMM
jgi:hypothetical protein